MKNILLFISILLFAVTSCRKDVNKTIVETDVPEPKVFVETAIRGKVVTVDQTPISFGNVQIADEIITIDANGQFFFENITVEKTGNIIKSNAGGFFGGSTHSNFSAEGSSFVEITMLPKENPVEMNSINGKTFTDDADMKISIPSNALRNSDGSPYTGMANIYSKYINPLADNLGTVMPGALTTIKDGGLETIETFGMMTFDLEKLNGDILTIDPNLTIDMEIPIPTELLDDAPAEIPLWYFDLEEEQWYQIGTCTLEGNVYVGCCIPGPGYYCTGISNPAICLSGTVLNNDNTPSFYMKVLVENLTDNFVYWGYTDINGVFCGSVPAGVELRISIIDHCNNTVYTETIGPFSSDTTLPTIQLVPTVETFVINISGQINECVIEPLTYGHVAITRPGKITIRPFAQGAMDIDYAMNCVDFPELQIRVYSGIQSAEMSELFILEDYTNLDVGEIFMCTETDDFFNITHAGELYSTMPTQWYWKENTSTDHMMLEGLGRGGKFTLQILNYTGIGTYDTGVLLSLENGADIPAIPELESASGNINLQITNDDGNYIEGNFEGTGITPLGASESILSEFKIKKRP